METHLPAPVTAYFEAVNRHDPDGMLAQFSDDAIVKDEGKTRRGRAAVSEWIRETNEKYHPSFEIERVRQAGGETIVKGLVFGTFKGSPLRLHYAFALDRGKISHLEIH
jgi:ketosteroid isomerase-like protein